MTRSITIFSITIKARHSAQTTFTMALKKHNPLNKDIQHNNKDTTLSITTFSLTIENMRLIINNTQHNNIISA
jgi:hypothetical protein